jgi:hypothetical protein
MTAQDATLHRLRELEAEVARLKGELATAHSALITAREVLEEHGFPDAPFLDVGVTAVCREVGRLREAVKALAGACSHCGGKGWVVTREADSGEDWQRGACECRRYLEALKDG